MTTPAVGLMSVTFRTLPAERVVELATEAGCSLIAWSGDVHVPVEAVDVAARVRSLTLDAGLQVESYGSYWRAVGGIEPWLDAAVAIDARRVRVWAGETASADAGEADRALVAERIAHAADVAAEHGIELALEFHRNTLTDTLASTLDLLAAIDERRSTDAIPVRSLWQPRHGIESDEAVHEVRVLGERLAAAHVFTWTEEGARRPLAEGAPVWTSVINEVSTSQHDVPFMLEFVRDDDEVQYFADVATLRGWVGGADGIVSRSTRTPNTP